MDIDNEGRDPRRIGSYLISIRAITAEQLKYGLMLSAIMAVSGTKKPIGETLIEAGLIKQYHLDRALMLQAEDRRRHEVMEANKTAIPRYRASKDGEESRSGFHFVNSNRQEEDVATAWKRGRAPKRRNVEPEPDADVA